MDRRKLCKYPVETNFYHKFDPVCSTCATPLNNEQTKLYDHRRKHKYYTVVPCCDQDACLKQNQSFEFGLHPGWICKRERGVSNVELKEKKKKRKAKHDIAQKKLSKKRKVFAN